MATRTKKSPKSKPPTETPATGLDERAMLVYLSIGFWEGRKKDKSKTDEVLKDEKADTDAGLWWTRTMPKSATNPILTARSAARAIHMKLTLPWQDQGFRILPATMYLNYTAEMRKCEAHFRAQVNNFLDRYPTLVSDAATRLGGLYKPEDFPSVGDIRDKYPWQIKVTPLPTASDFRVNLGSDQTEAIKKSIQSQADAAMADAMGDLWERLHEAVKKMADRLGDSEGVFRDSLVENIAGLCEILPKMNITGDKQLETARQEVLSKLSKAEPEVLRKNKSARADTAKAANDILKKMEAFLPKKGK
jgi:hypothetical protein